MIPTVKTPLIHCGYIPEALKCSSIAHRRVENADWAKVTKSNKARNSNLLNEKLNTSLTLDIRPLNPMH